MSPLVVLVWWVTRIATRRAAGDDPVFEVSLIPHGDWAGWYQLQLAVRNYWQSWLLVESVALQRPDEAWLLPDITAHASGQRPAAKALLNGGICVPLSMKLPPTTGRFPLELSIGTRSATIFTPRQAASIAIVITCIRRTQREKRIAFRMAVPVPRGALNESA